MTTLKRTRELQFYICLIIISLIVLMWLIAPLFYPDAWNGYFQQADPDSLLFSRQLEQSILKGKILTTDNYAAFPYETPTGFAPFYMWFLVSFVSLVFYFFPNISIDPIYIAGMLPIIIPWLTTIFLLLSIYKLSNNKILTLFCAIGMLPGYATMMVSGFMKLDYDFIITFLIWAWIIFGAFYIKTEKHGYVYAGAIITALFISTWTGAPFFYFFACIYSLIIWFYNPKDKQSYLTYSSITMLIGSIIALIFVPRTEDTFRYFITVNVGRYSFTQGILVLLGSFYLMLLNRISNYKSPRKIGIILMSIFAVFIIVFFHETLYQATGIIFQKDPIHATIIELTTGFNFKNIFGDAIKDGMYKFNVVFLFFSICFFIPLKSTDKKELRLILNWLLIFTFLSSFYQVRYIRWISCGYGLVIGFTSYYLWEIIKKASTKSKLVLPRIAIILFPILLVVITINYYVISSSIKFVKEEIDLLSWIKEQTPATSGYSNDIKPEYGILSYWDKGNMISFYAKRPVCVSNSLWGYKTMAEVFSGESEKESFELCNSYSIKYILINPSWKVRQQILCYWPLMKNMPQTPEYKLYYGEIPQRDDFDYFYFWLADNLGLTPLGDFTITEHFRIVFANKNDGKTVSKFILFEKVDGAKICFNIEPNSKVSLSLEFKLGEMSFIYKVNKTADEKGLCQFILPYSNDYDCGNIITDPFYKISIEKDGIRTLAKLVVTNSDVVEGKTVDLDKQFEFVGQ